MTDSRNIFLLVDRTSPGLGPNEHKRVLMPLSECVVATPDITNNSTRIWCKQHAGHTPAAHFTAYVPFDEFCTLLQALDMTVLDLLPDQKQLTPS